MWQRWRRLSSRIREGQFLPIDTNISQQWAGTDTEQRYHSNLTTQPQDWLYRTHTVKYTVNSQGYRCPEFSTIDWSQSLVVFGCSMVFGIGVTDQDTMPAQLSRITGLPVINMGQAASSIEFSLHNSAILHQHCARPRAVIQLWTDPDRTIYYLPRSVEFLGSWTDHDYQRARSRSQSHTDAQALFAEKISRAMWSDTGYWSGSYSHTTSKLLQIPDCHRHDDDARDLWHPGTLSHGRVARQIASDLGLA